MKINCFSCHKEFDIDENQTILRSEECPHCFANIRSCKMCDFYDQNSYNECRESSAERIVEKEKSNFCDFYKIGNQQENNLKINNAKAAADALFKK